MERRLVFTGKGKVAIEDYRPDAPQAGEVAIRTLCSLMSTGTEGIVFNRLFDPGTHWDEWVKYPFYPGYAALGEVIQVGPDVTSFRKGDRVMTRCEHASWHNVGADKCYPVPASIPDDQAVWFALGKIAAMGARAAELELGSNLVVIGAGPIGQMAVRWARVSGAENIVVVDFLPLRLELARKGGATSTINRPIAEAGGEVTRVMAGRTIDVVIDTTGNAAVFSSALAMLGRFGRLVLLGDTGSPDSQHLTPDLINRGLAVVGAHDSNETPEWNARRIARLFFALVADGRFQLEGLTTHTFRPEACAQAYETATKRRAETMGILFDWRSPA